MKVSERTLRIGAASVLAVLMVSASYLLSGPSFLSDRIANAGTTEELLKAYASKDSDGDNLPDWQEALYGTDPSKAISNSFGIPDGQAAQEGKLTPNSLSSKLPSATEEKPTTEDLLNDIPGINAAPGSITDEFSKEFFQQYVETSKGQSLSDEDTQALVASLLSKFSQKAAKKLSSSYTLVSVHTNSSATVTGYAGQVENIFVTNDVARDANQPVLLMEALVQNNDESARPKLKALAKSYGDIVTDLRAVEVPPQLASQHLALIRGFDELNKATLLVANYEEDPLGVMGALSIYQPSSQDVVDGIKSIATVILASGEPAAGMPGAMIVSIARSTETP
jgi:hypothetical protein